MPQKISYQLGGLTKPGCKQNIEGTLSEVSALQNVHVDMQTKELTLEYDPDRVGEDYIKSTLNAMGYSVLGQGGGIRQTDIQG